MLINTKKNTIILIGIIKRRWLLVIYCNREEKWSKFYIAPIQNGRTTLIVDEVRFVEDIINSDADGV